MPQAQRSWTHVWILVPIWVPLTFIFPTTISHYRTQTHRYNNILMYHKFWDFSPLSIAHPSVPATPGVSLARSTPVGPCNPRGEFSGFNPWLAVVRMADDWLVDAMIGWGAPGCRGCEWLALWLADEWVVMIGCKGWRGCWLTVWRGFLADRYFWLQN